jgi:EAL domain-containing protein (putative c-di-GMP-specific phosphodiesterase class I)
MQYILQYKIDPCRLKLELTEGVLLQNIEETISNMNKLKDLGIRFSLDDFGTGYSSLQYLRRFPLSQLKIDQSFVRELVTDNNDQAIVSTIIAMARSLQLDVIAEGVETSEQRALLAEMGCHRYQGYLFGKPVPAAVFQQFLTLTMPEIGV